jgi:predicted nuclease of predicted toxin-antitoxin system
MRLLVDANLSSRIVVWLASAGFEAVHMGSIGLLTADDATILDYAESGGYALVTADTDFPTLMALRRAVSPSVVLLRGVTEQPPEAHAELLTANLPSIASDLDRVRSRRSVRPGSAFVTFRSSETGRGRLPRHRSGRHRVCRRTEHPDSTELGEHHQKPGRVVLKSPARTGPRRWQPNPCRRPDPPRRT